MESMADVVGFGQRSFAWLGDDCPKQPQEYVFGYGSVMATWAIVFLASQPFPRLVRGLRSCSWWLTACPVSMFLLSTFIYRRSGTFQMNEMGRLLARPPFWPVFSWPLPLPPSVCRVSVTFGVSSSLSYKIPITAFSWVGCLGHNHFRYLWFESRRSYLLWLSERVTCRARGQIADS